MYIVDLLRTNFVSGQSGFSREGLLNVLAFVVALLAAMILHEIAHGLVALWNGDRTAKMYGRLSLNPLRHFDWIGLAMMILVGFGWARPVPVNPNNFKKRRLGCITVSLAGVVTNLLLAFLFAMGAILFDKLLFGIEVGSAKYYVVYFLFALCMLAMMLNVNFALFNILPLYPLDGYRLLSCFVNERNGFMTFLRRYSLYIMLGFILLDYIPFVSAYSPLNLYIGWLGNKIYNGFLQFWGLIFYG